MGRLNDTISDYAKKDPVRFHMPGHKGRPLYAPDYALDVTELFFTDNLYDPDPGINIINELENRVSKCFFKNKDVNSFISCAGATLCIQGAALALAKSKKRAKYIICDRASHISFVNAISLLDIKPVWVCPDEDFAEKIGVYAQKNKNIIGVFVTSPDYYGAMKDIKRIAEECKKNSLPLAVDNSHGAHLAFHNGGGMHPINLGADISVDSIHKTLPVLTGAAILHADKKFDGMKQCINAFASTSPSYLILQSIEKAVDLLEKRGHEEHARLMGEINLFRQRAESLGFAFDTGGLRDPFRIVLNCGGAGEKLYYFLSEKNIFCEFFTEDRVTAIPGISNCAGDFDRLYGGLKDFAQANKILPAKPGGYGYPPGVPEVL